jgi:hypothetical protein
VKDKTKTPCPVPGCPGGFTTHQQFHKHFQARHPADSICIKEQGHRPLPKCKKCGLQLDQKALNTTHTGSAHCRELQKKATRRKLQQNVYKALLTEITAMGIPLEKVSCFRYLGRVISDENTDWPAIIKNIKKAPGSGDISPGHSSKQPHIVGMFYKAIVQSVLLFGSETWVITPDMLLTLEGFHNTVARRISGMMPSKTPNGEWHYPPLAQALQKAGLYTLVVKYES